MRTFGAIINLIIILVSQTKIQNTVGNLQYCFITLVFILQVHTLDWKKKMFKFLVFVILIVYVEKGAHGSFLDLNKKECEQLITI